MISEQSFESKILNPNILADGVIYSQYCLISKIMTKLDSSGKCFLQINFRGKDGTPILGRMFGEEVSEYLDNIEKYINSVVFAEFCVDIVYGQKCLNVNWMRLPEGEEFKGIKIDLFESLVPNIDDYVSVIKDTFNKYESIYTETCNNIMKQSAFSALYYKSDEAVCSGQCGYGYVLLNNCWKRFEEYYKLGYITQNDVAIMMTAQLLAECILIGYDNINADYKYVVYVRIGQLMQQLSKLGTEAEYKNLRTVLISYVDLRLGNPSDKTESKLARIMHSEFKTLYSNLEYLTSLNLYKGTMLFNGKVVR